MGVFGKALDAIQRGMIPDRPLLRKSQVLVAGLVNSIGLLGFKRQAIVRISFLLDVAVSS